MAVPGIKDDVEETDDDQTAEEPTDEDDSDTDPNMTPATETEDEEEPETETETEDEEEPVEEVDLPEDDDDVEESGESGGSFLAGSTFGVSNKILLGAGVAAVVAVWYLQRLDPPESSTKSYESKEDVEEALDDGSDGGVSERQDVLSSGGSDGRYSQDAQDTAVETLFGSEN